MPYGALLFMMLYSETLDPSDPLLVNGVQLVALGTESEKTLLLVALVVLFFVANVGVYLLTTFYNK